MWPPQNLSVLITGNFLPVKAFMTDDQTGREDLPRTRKQKTISRFTAYFALALPKVNDAPAALPARSSAGRDRVPLTSNPLTHE